MDRRLLLRDRDANLIVDVLVGAEPTEQNDGMRLNAPAPRRSHVLVGCQRARCAAGAGVDEAGAPAAGGRAAQAGDRDLAAARQGLGALRHHRRHRHRRPQSQYEVGAQMTKARQIFPFEFVIMLGDNIYGSERPQDFVEEVREAVRRLLTSEDSVLRVARQPRRPDAALLQAVQHERRALLHLQEGRRTLLRAGQQLHGPAAAEVAGGTAVASERSVEDRLLPSSAVLVGRQARVGSRPAHAPRAALREVRRGRRLRRTRALLRAASCRRRASTTSRRAAPRSCARATSARAR